MRILRRSWPIITGAVLVALIAIGTAEVNGRPNSEAQGTATSSPPTAPLRSATTDGSTPSAGPTAASTAESTAEPVAGTALSLLATLEVRGRAPKTGYDRENDFGRAWIDVDHNGCDTRNDILTRDVIVTSRDGCLVLTGLLEDPYTGTSISFVRGARTSSAVQIDHVVPLMDAWQKGAQQLTRDERINLANDPVNLLAVDGTENSRKSDGDAATWLPPRREVWCEYVARQVSVKARYKLWVTDAEHSAMARVLGTCPQQSAY